MSGDPIRGFTLDRYRLETSLFNLCLLLWIDRALAGGDDRGAGWVFGVSLAAGRGIRTVVALPEDVGSPPIAAPPKRPRSSEGGQQRGPFVSDESGFRISPLLALDPLRRTGWVRSTPCV